MSFSYYKLNKDDEKLIKYIDKRNGVLSYRFFPEIDLVLPKAGAKIVHYTDEFTDVMVAQDILKNGMGLHDDGVDPGRTNFVAIGDSFTRGVGSTNTLKFGWIELVEKKFDKVDIVNLGLGQGINDQRYVYEKLKKFFNHKYVIYNFFTGGDYTDNLQDHQWSNYLAKNKNKMSEKEIQDFIDNLNTDHGYKFHMEYLKNNTIKSYSVYFTLKIYDLLINKGFFEGNNPFKNLPKKWSRLNIVDDKLYNLAEKFYLKQTVECRKYCYEHNPYFVEKEFRSTVVENSAKLINRFNDELKKNNKELIIFIHPSARNFYDEQTDYNYNGLDENLKESIDKDIKVLDLKFELINYEKQYPSKKLFHKVDGHFTIEGYEVVSNIVKDFLKKEIDYAN